MKEDVAEPMNQDIAEAEAESRLLGRLDHALGACADRRGRPGAGEPHAEAYGARARARRRAPRTAGTLEAAERELRDAVASDPASAEAHENLALALARLGRLDDADSSCARRSRRGVRVAARPRGDRAAAGRARALEKPPGR